MEKINLVYTKFIFLNIFKTMEKFPELNTVLGYRQKPITRAILVIIVLIVMVITVIIFLIASGYISVKSPTEKIQ